MAQPDICALAVRVAALLTTERVEEEQSPEDSIRHIVLTAGPTLLELCAALAPQLAAEYSTVPEVRDNANRVAEHFGGVGDGDRDAKRAKKAKGRSSNSSSDAVAAADEVACWLAQDPVGNAKRSNNNMRLRMAVFGPEVYDKTVAIYHRMIEGMAETVGTTEALVGSLQANLTSSGDPRMASIKPKSLRQMINQEGARTNAADAPMIATRWVNTVSDTGEHKVVKKFVKDAMECPVCFTERADVLFGACGHKYCGACKAAVRVCPSCRGPKC
jgi:hypothetical protein